MKATQRLCRTADGRLVSETDPDAAFLAYAVGKELSAADEALLNSAPADEPPAGEAKAEPAAPNKARKQAPNKAK